MKWNHDTKIYKFREKIFSHLSLKKRNSPQAFNPKFIRLRQIFSIHFLLKDMNKNAVL